MGINYKKQKIGNHPLRCESCAFGERLVLDASKICCSDPTHNSYPVVFACKKQEGHWMPSQEDGNPIATVGCASHSNYTGGMIQVIDLIRDRIKELKKMPKTDERTGLNDCVRLALLGENQAMLAQVRDIGDQCGLHE